MPVKRRRAKAREYLPAWGMVFQAGYDLFGDLTETGVETDEHGRPSRAVTEAAWQLLGRAYLEQHHDPHHTPWALREFGEPWRKRHASA